jgi:hypothetical protein
MPVYASFAFLTAQGCQVRAGWGPRNRPVQASVGMRLSSEVCGDNRSPIWGGATLGLVVGLILGFFVGSYWITVLYTVLIGAAVGLATELLARLGHFFARR